MIFRIQRGKSKKKKKGGPVFFPSFESSSEIIDCIKWGRIWILLIVFQIANKVKRL